MRENKNNVVKKQKYEEAARLRDDEKRVERNLISAQENGKNQNSTVLKSMKPISLMWFL